MTKIHDHKIPLKSVFMERCDFDGGGNTLNKACRLHAANSGQWVPGWQAEFPDTGFQNFLRPPELARLCNNCCVCRILPAEPSPIKLQLQVLTFSQLACLAEMDAASILALSMLKWRQHQSMPTLYCTSYAPYTHMQFCLPPSSLDLITST